MDIRLNIALLVLRVYAGVALMFHGWSKIQNPLGWMGPDAAVHPVLQGLAALSEFGGGLAFVVGLLTPLAGLGVLCTMAVAMNYHMSKGDPFVGMGGSWEPAGLYFVIALVMILAGPGAWSLDARIFKRNK